MKRPRSVIATALAATALSASALTAAAAVPAAAAPASAGGLPAGPAGAAGTALTTLVNSAVPFTAVNKLISTVPAASRLTLQFWLAPRTAAAEGFAGAVSAPGSPRYRHFLSPAAYTSEFAAAPAAAASVEQWLTTQGFTGVATDPGRDYVRATAPVRTIENALHIALDYYKATGIANAGAFALRANNGPVSLPASLAGLVAGVTGLDNASPVMTYKKAVNPDAVGRPAQSGPSFACSQWYAQHYGTGLPARFGHARFPTVICGYTPQQLRAAYGYSSANAGAGVTVAFTEVGLAPLMFDTLNDYARVHGLQQPSAQRYAELSLGRGPECGDPFNTEEQLDVEAAYSMAPLEKQLVVGGDSCDNGDYGLQALYDADLAVLDGGGGSHPLASIVSNSWEAGDETIPASLLTIEHDYLIKAACEGVTMLFASGDASGVEVPSSDPYATAVGGTTLALGHNGRLFETGWSTGISAYANGAWAFQGEQGAAGGGASLLWRRPSYQQSVVPGSLATPPGDRGGLVRAVPDISAVADPFTGLAVGMLTFDPRGNVTGYTEQSVGGTSLATPVVAGVLADAEQGSRAFGYINPALYKLARERPGVYHGTSPLTAESSPNDRGVACDAAMCGILSLTTFDDQSWTMSGYTGQVTAPGYDTMTGVGTPNGQQFITALRNL
jgi:subtilase family serine protease